MTCHHCDTEINHKNYGCRIGEDESEFRFFCDECQAQLINQEE